MERRIVQVLQAREVVNDGDMRLLRALPQAGCTALGPFVFLDHYRHAGLRGIGDEPHPHAGIEVVSYLLEGTAEHRDSMGFHDRLGPGDAQVIRAGRGMLHAERALSGRHGLQLWASLPPALKLTEPSYAVLRAADIPAASGQGWRLPVLAGQVNGITGPLVLSSDTVFARLHLEAGAAAALDAAAAPELGLYVAQGRVRVGAAPLGQGQLGILGPGTRLDITAADGEAELALIGGAPVVGAVLFSGPFVMDTPERLAQAKRDFSAGRMGRLDGVPF